MKVLINNGLYCRSLSVVQRLLMFVGLALMISCYSPQPVRRPNPYPPAPRPWSPPAPPPDPCATFDPCACALERFRIDLLDERLERPGNTPTERGEAAANFRRMANDLKNEYWSTKRQEKGIWALRFYDGYLRLVPPSDSYAPFALLQSTALYCGLGCREKARDLAQELRYGYRYNSAEIDKALAYCR